MYVVTFYSYKGGVGRTMTLMNVAAELVKRGRKVMVVDFDLEAPGLTTYGFCENAATKLGVVDYVVEYSRTLVAPDVREFITTCRLSGEAGADIGELLIMSAGRQDENYRDKFYSINWDELYSAKSGYLMMEDLKAQWNAFFSPDYVFIDSRTGITDISGICTRQFPDAVAITFFPNRQNLSGLKRIVNEIRLEERGSRQKNIALHFISSNTPSADDEHGILKRNLEEFRAELRYEVGAIIHYYNSLSIVDQVIFTLQKPKTQLAQEYRQLTDTIVKQNPADRDGVLKFVGDIANDRNNLGHFGGLADVQDRLFDLRQRYAADGEVLNRLGDAKMTLMRSDDAADLYRDAIKNGFSTPETFRNLAISCRQAEDKQGALTALTNLLERPDAAAVDALFALKWIIELDDALLPSVLQLPAISGRDPIEKYVLVDQFLRSKLEFSFPALALLDETLSKSDVPARQRESLISLKSWILIAQGRCQEALDLMGDRNSLLKSGPIYKLFNFAMAEWGAHRSVPIDLLVKVVELDAQKPGSVEDPNYCQCLAVACWAIGNVDSARSWIDLARKRASTKKPSDAIHSCWQYLNVPKAEFLTDVALIESLIDGNDIDPAFMHVTPYAGLTGPRVGSLH